MLKAFGSKYYIDSSAEADEYYGYVKDLLDSDIVNQMKNYTHHYSTTCFQHCLNVSYYNYLLCRKLRLNTRDAARAGMLHDLFLYDRKTREKKDGEKSHSFHHPEVALNNAQKYFDIDDREEDMIRSHMWPLASNMPKYAESFAISAVDKYIATLELLTYAVNTVKKKCKIKFKPSYYSSRLQ
ncbi:MAG: HDIG domain-containing metalloprotein [Oscillospiraceae bacterium]